MSASELFSSADSLSTSRDSTGLNRLSASKKVSYLQRKKLLVSFVFLQKKLAGKL
jgi:hypothetical protein